MFHAKIRAAILGALIIALSLPAAAHASRDLAISQTPSANVADAGGSVTITVTVTNKGTEAIADGDAYANLFSFRGHGAGANNPYQSVTTSQGTCTDQSQGGYQNQICSVGSLANGASAQIVAVVKVNESMNHFAELITTPTQAGAGVFQDDDNSNNESSVRITASTPPTVSGSKKIKLTGLPAGCASGDFTLVATAKVKGVKKMAASWQVVAKGNRLRAKVPASRLANDLGVSYTLKVKAKRGGAKPLKVSVTFQPC